MSLDTKVETSSYPGWIKSPHVVTLSVVTLGSGLSDNFHFFLCVCGGEGGILPSQNSKSTKICLNSNWGGEGGILYFRIGGKL